MTDGQIRFQTLMENQRHNLAMERFGEKEAQAALEQAKSREREVTLKEVQWPTQQSQIEQSMRAEAIRTGITGAKDIISTWSNFLGTVAKMGSLMI